MIPAQQPIVWENTYIGKPVRSLQMMLRVIAESDNDIPSIVPDGDYGSNTQRSVLAFQKKNGLTPNGRVNFETWEAIREGYQAAMIAVGPAAPLRIILQPNQVIVRGEKNTHLVLMQAMLLALADFYDNVPTISITGVYDEPTVHAVHWLQKLGHLEQCEEINKKTWQLLSQLYRIAVGDGTGYTSGVPLRRSQREK